MIKPHRINAFLLRHLYELKASVDRKTDIVFWPTIDILTFGFLTVYIDKLDVRAGVAGAILGALILWTLVYHIQRDITLCVLDDAWSRNLYNLFSTPLTISEIVIATIIMSFLKALVSIVVVISLAAGIFHFNILTIGPALLFYLINIFVFGWAFGFFTTFLIFRFGTRLQTVAWSLIAVIYPISGVFYPLSTLPGSVATVAKVFPLSHIFENLRGILLNQTAPEVGSYLLIAGLNIVYFGLGISFYVYGFNHAKKRGWFIHPS